MLPRILALAAACLPAALSADPAPALPSAFDAKWHGKTVCEPLFENAAMRAARCTFPPGGGHERHYHPPHWGYIVTGGTMRITDASGTKVRELKAGSNWWSDGIAWHEAVNVGTTTSVYIIVEPNGRATAALEQTQIPPRREGLVAPPPPIRDPIPGPYFISFNDRGELDKAQITVIEGAVKSWVGARTDAFMLCFRSPKTPTDYDASVAALKAVSSELKARGATMIVLPPGRFCEAPPHPAIAGKRVVEILGLVRD